VKSLPDYPQHLYVLTSAPTGRLPNVLVLGALSPSLATNRVRSTKG
jgi:hypothetical protein